MFTHNLQDRRELFEKNSLIKRGKGEANKPFTFFSNENKLCK